MCRIRFFAVLALGLVGAAATSNELVAQGPNCELCHNIGGGQPGEEIPPACEYAGCHTFGDWGVEFDQTSGTLEPGIGYYHGIGAIGTGICLSYHVDCHPTEEIQEMLEAVAQGDVDRLVGLVRGGRVEFNTSRAALQVIGCSDSVVAQSLITPEIAARLVAEIEQTS